MYGMKLIIYLHAFTSQVGSEDAGEFDITSDAWKKLVNTKSKTTTSPNNSELDHFMVLHTLINGHS